MAYTINKTDGTVVATIADGTIDTSTSLTLFGQNYSGFGELLNENLIKLLENSSSTSSPTNPLKGELWFDNNTGQLKVYNGTQFEPTGGAQSSATKPSNPSIGDLWLDSTNDQVFVYTGDSRTHQINDEWELLGPAFTASQTQSGFVIETIASSGGDKVVASMYAGTTRVAILSKETFTPSASQTGFATIKAGITLNSTLSAVFEGTTTSASSMDVSSTSNTSATIIAGGNFLRADVADTTVGALTVDNDTGVIIGDAQELTISVSSNNVTLAQTSEDKDFTISTNTGGTQTNRLAITGASGAMAITGDVTITGNLNISGEYNSSVSNVSTYDDAFIKVNSGNSEVDAGLIVETSDTDDARLFYEVGTNRWMAGENQNYSQIITDAIATTNGATSQGSVLKTDSSGTVTVAGVTLSAVGTISEGDTSNAAVPTIGAVVTFGDLWGGSAKTVSTAQPTSGDGDNGDFWFVREA
tara:strand:- start:2962 stop:4377 length:1416 start_codon:yes stop_codon:yes gene_type:complete